MAVWLLPDPVHDAALLASVEVMTGRIKGPTGEEQELYEAIWRPPHRPFTVPAPSGATPHPRGHGTRG